MKENLLGIIKSETGIDHNSTSSERSVLRNKDIFKRIMLALINTNFSSYQDSSKHVFASMSEFLTIIKSETDEFLYKKKKLVDTSLGFNTLNVSAVFSYGTKMLRDTIPAPNSEESKHVGTSQCFVTNLKKQPR